MEAYCVILLLAQRPDERNIPDVFSIIIVNRLRDKRIRVGLPLIHPTAFSARARGLRTHLSLQAWRLHPGELCPIQLRRGSGTREVDLGGHELITST
jgi:hypothetical protein